MKAKNVYVVTAGEYSDYGIKAIFSKKKDAEAFATQGYFSGDEGNVEEWPLDGMKGAVRRLCYRYRLPDGRGWSFEENARPTERTPTPSSTIGRNGRGEIWVYGDSFVGPDHAKKLAEEALQAELRKKTESGV